MRYDPSPKRFVEEEDGITSVWHLMTMMTVLAIGGFAIDHSRVMSEQLRLQVAADTTAHAAAWAIVDLDEDGDVPAQLAAARAAGMVYANDNLDQGRGDAILASDIQFGTWDQATRTFTERSVDIDAVRVMSRRTTGRQNPLPTTYLGLVSLDSFDVAADAVFQLEMPKCAKDGMMAMGEVNISSGSTFESGYCIHGQTGVDLQNGNTFMPGTVVSMPDLSMLDGSTDGNTGLAEALRQERHNPPELWNVTATMDAIEAGESAATGKWYDATQSVTVTPFKGNADRAPDGTYKGDLLPSHLTEYAFNNVECKGNTLFIGAEPVLNADGTTSPVTAIFSNVVIRTSCPVTFRQGVRLENAVVMSDSLSSKAFSAPSGLTIGKDDTCADGGNVLLITPGSMEFASKIQMHGSQLIAGGDIDFSASGQGVYGGQMLAGGDINSTSGLKFGPCPRGAHVLATMRPMMRD